jgi:hypothetical protein
MKTRKLSKLTALITTLALLAGMSLTASAFDDFFGDCKGGCGELGFAMECGCYICEGCMLTGEISICLNCDWCGDCIADGGGECDEDCAVISVSLGDCPDCPYYDIHFLLYAYYYDGIIICNICEVCLYFCCEHIELNFVEELGLIIGECEACGETALLCNYCGECMTECCECYDDWDWLYGQDWSWRDCDFCDIPGLSCPQCGYCVLCDWELGIRQCSVCHWGEDCLWSYEFCDYCDDCELCCICGADVTVIRDEPEPEEPDAALEPEEPQGEPDIKPADEPGDEEAEAREAAQFLRDAEEAALAGNEADEDQDRAAGGDGNPETGVTFGLTAVIMAGAALAASRKRR